MSPDDKDEKEGEVIPLRPEGQEQPPNPLEPVVTAIAKELAKLADPDGVVRVGGEDEASRARTAALVRGLGVGLGNALAEAFAKWAEKIQSEKPDDKK
jgi:hypothetical protein